MANEKMRENWTKYGGPGRIEHQRIFAAVYAPLSAALVARLEPLDGMTVLDVGCGAGGLSAAVVERGGKAIGVDISETVIEGARRLVPEATFVVADAQVADLYGIDGSDGVEERMALITSGLTGRLAEQQLRPLLGDDGWSALLDEVRADLRQRVVDGDLAVPCATWIVTARRGTG